MAAARLPHIFRHIFSSAKAEFAMALLHWRLILRNIASPVASSQTYATDNYAIGIQLVQSRPRSLPIRFKENIRLHIWPMFHWIRSGTSDMRSLCHAVFVNQFGALRQKPELPSKLLLSAAYIISWVHCQDYGGYQFIFILTWFFSSPPIVSFHSTEIFIVLGVEKKTHITKHSEEGGVVKPTSSNSFTTKDDQLLARAQQTDCSNCFANINGFAAQKEFKYTSRVYSNFGFD